MNDPVRRNAEIPSPAMASHSPLPAPTPRGQAGHGGAPTPGASAAKDRGASRSENWELARFLLGLGLAVLLLRGLFLTPFTIPSESMQPRLLIGDYLLVNKMAYGYSRFSVPGLSWLPEGRLFERMPRRGDVAVFRAPPSGRNDYIKRVIGLPGDTVAVEGGIVRVNGAPIARRRVADFVTPVTPNMVAAAETTMTGNPCFAPDFLERAPSGALACRYPRFEERLPDGRRWFTLDLGDQPMDDFGPLLVPEGQLFLMGDNRDRSADSRFPAVEGGGIGLVPVDHLVGRALVGLYSTDGSAAWYNPISWLTATRYDRIGDGF